MTIENLLNNPQKFEKMRLFWADKVCSFRDGTNGKRSAEIIKSFVEKGIILSRNERIRRYKLLHPYELPIFNPYLRRAKQFLLACLSYLKEPLLITHKLKQNFKRIINLRN